ncbi:hypothetical protein Tco_1175036 [Tanacetum coccineum]
MMLSCYAFSSLHSLEPLKGRWTDFLQEPSIPGISLRKPLSKDSSGNSEGITAIVSKLNSLGRDMKKLKENIHAIQVGYQTYGGAHLDKECPLNEEVKSVEEVKYGEFGRSSPFSNAAKYRVGPPRYYNCPPCGEKSPSLEELMSKHLEEST